MVFILIFLVILGLIAFMDRKFYLLIYGILDFKGLDASQVLNSLGYYNKSVFSSRLRALLLVLFISLLIYSIFLLSRRKSKRLLAAKIKELEDFLIRINQGDYRIDIGQNDEFSPLRDEIYKIIVSLKSLEEEAKRQKLGLKDDLANIAHQIKTPLTSIGFMAELIESDPENSQEYLRRMNGQIERLQIFTDTLLKLSKLNSNTIQYKFREISVLELIYDVLRNLDPDSIDLEFKGDDFLLWADELWLYEAFLNLIKNSLEYTDSKISFHLSENSIYKELIISDNGPGMKQEEIDHIFDRFYRGHNSLPGYGIGLNLSKSILEDHKAELSAFNQQGLNFRIKFYNVT